MEIKVVDARGEACPIPVVKAIRALGEMTGPGTLEVHVDNETAVQNVMRMASGKGLTPVSEKLGEGHFVIRAAVESPVNVPASDVREAENACAPDARSRTVVAIDTNVMGRGSDELGTALMKGFIYALSQQETLPATILFYNGGAKLTTEGSVSIQDLKNMEAQGVEILTCGTCLNFYGLTDKLQVGGVTNMYTIVEKLSLAGKVIKP